MFSKIANYFHILKAKIVVAYALFHVFDTCADVYIRDRIFRPLVSNTLFLIKNPLITLNKGFPIKIRFKHEYEKAKEAIAIYYQDFFKQYVAHRQTPSADYVYVKIECPALGSYFPRIIGVAWLCEKLGINVKFTFPDTYITSGSNFFENSVLNYAKTCHPENFAKLKKPLINLDYREGIYPSPWENFLSVKFPANTDIK